jgi:16S rRNA (cytosine967-C5)-methyltransferase
MTKIKPVNERELVLGILMEVTEKGQYSHLVLRDVLGKYQYLDKKERAFITRVTEGTLEHMIELDYILDQFSKVKVKKMKPVIRNILRSAVYQLKYMDTVPDSAVCNEAVKLAVKKGFSGLRGFVNGVLRSTSAGLGQVRYPSDPVEGLSVRYSMPVWILRLWLQSYDRQTVETMLREFQKEKPLTVRVRPSLKNIGEGGGQPSKGTGAEAVWPEVLKLQKELEGEGIRLEPHPYLPYACYLSGQDYLGELQSFREGRFSVQDVSSMLVCEAAAPKPGDVVIDVCAAPGGKAVHMAEMLRGTGSVEARDLTAYKTGLIQENIDRSGLSNIQARQMDARVLDAASAEKADIVIADLPCSGLGVLGKKTDLKYNVTEESLESLVKLQREILTAAKAYVRPGGKLVYSTCTINPSENLENVHWFLEQNPEFALRDIRESLCEELKGDVQEKGCLQLLPGIHKSDGFFLACMEKGLPQRSN